MDRPFRGVASVRSFPLTITSLGNIKTKAKVVIAIDFGTTYSGVAYVYKSNPDYVQCGAPGLPSNSGEQVKVPTVLLKSPDGDWSFGWGALDKYDGICRECEDDASDHQTVSDLMKEKGVSLFRTFKMELKGKTSGMDTLTANSTFGRPHSLMDLITRSLGYLSRYALNELKNGWLGYVDATDENIQWVLTVPAIWNDFGKAFMRKAAFKAGLIDEEGSERLRLALEPESAVLAVHAAHRLLKRGKCFVVVDCGGGTVDITSHKVTTDNPLVLDEIRPPVGGPWGDMYVDLEFETFLRKLLGREAFEQVEMKYPIELSEAMNEFRNKKEKFAPGDGVTYISLAGLFTIEVMDDVGMPNLLRLMEAYNSSSGEAGACFDLSTRSIAKKIRKHSMLPFSESQMLGFFEPSLKKICSKVKTIMNDHAVVRTIIVVGGYGFSKVLGDRIRDEFEKGGKIRVIVPSAPLGPQAAIVQGAACFGLYTSVIGTRVSSFTYGVDTTMRWSEGCGYPRSDAEFDKKLRELVVQNVFSTIVKKDTSISPGERFCRKGYSPLYDDQTSVGFSVFKSFLKDPKRTNTNCDLLGEVNIPCSSPQDRFDVEFSFDTELKVKVTRQDGEVRSVVIQME